MSGGTGSTLQGIASLLGTLFGTGTTTTNQDTNSNTNFSGTNTNNSTTTTNTNGLQTTKGQTNTSNQQNSETQGVVNPIIGGIETGIVGQAINNANDPAKINALITSTINKAATEFGQSTGNPGRAAGLYDSTTTGMLKGYTEAQATSQAVGTALNYQTTEQQIASDANKALLAATSGQKNTTSGTTSSETEQLISNILKGIQNIAGITTSAGKSATTSQTQGTSGNGGLLGSVICTELVAQGKMDHRLYSLVTKHFQTRVPIFGQRSYHIWAKYAVRHLQDHPSDKLSQFIAWITIQRACFVVRELGLTKMFPWTFSGLFARTAFQLITWLIVVFIYLPRRLSNDRHINYAK